MYPNFLTYRFKRRRTIEGLQVSRSPWGRIFSPFFTEFYYAGVRGIALKAADNFGCLPFPENALQIPNKINSILYTGRFRIWYSG
jgi:hypothetical protein